MLVFNRPAKKQLQKSFLHTFCCRYEWLKKNPKDISGNPFSRSHSHDETIPTCHNKCRQH